MISEFQILDVRKITSFPENPCETSVLPVVKALFVD
jgi:hypothetical protein